MRRASSRGAAPAERWRRRALTVPAYLLATLFLCATLPLWLALAALRDLFVRRRGITLRLVLFGAWYLLCESAGLIAGFGVWLATGPWTGASRERFERANFRLQCLWTGALFGGVRRIFDVGLRVEGSEQIEPGPVLVLIRHASLADVLLPAVLFSSRHGLRLRYVVKRELLYDPCIDVVGHRLHNVFVDRAAAEPDAEIALVRSLAHDLATDEGVLIYPEGTRFSPSRRKRALEKVKSGRNPARYDRVRQLRHLLPPRIGGPAALLEACPDTDVLVVGHVGLDGLARVPDLTDGSLVGRRLAVRVWRVPAREIPRDHAARVEWLDGWWRRVDDWIHAELEARGGRP